MPRKKLIKELLEPAVASSLSMREAMRKFGITPLTGGSQTHFTKKVRQFGISTAHFLGQSRNKGTISINRKTADQFLVYHADGQRQRCRVLVRSLLEKGREYKCFVCGISDWQSKKLVFEIEHKDGDFQNDKEENLEFICPNCHSQTDTYCRQKASLGKKEKKTRVPKPPKERKPPWRKVKLPLLEEIQSLAEKMSFDNVGKIYGVSGNAVRKWFVGYTGTVPKFKRA